MPCCVRAYTAPEERWPPGGEEALVLSRLQQNDQPADAAFSAADWDREQSAGVPPVAPTESSFSVQATPQASRTSSRSSSRPLMPGPRPKVPQPRPSPEPGEGGSAAAQATMFASMMVLIYEAIAYNVVYLGRILPAMGKDFLVLPYMFVFNSMWGLAVWSYVVAHTSDPGVVPSQWYDFVHQVGDGLPVVPAKLDWQPGKATLCRKCCTPRPERAHHCHICGICVLRMDHHCPWIKNCVGFKNHKFFLLLVVYCTMSASLGLVLSMPDLFYCVKALLHTADTRDGQPYIEFSDIMVFMIFELLALFFIALLFPMVVAHIPLAAKNLTSIETHYDDLVVNPFDRGSAMANLSSVFGEFGLDWFFPVYPHRPTTDGVSFPRNAADAARWEDLSLGNGGNVIGAVEALWRLRYNVQAKAAPRPPADGGGYGPIAALARWASGTVDGAGAQPGSPNYKCTRPAAPDIL